MVMVWTTDLLLTLKRIGKRTSSNCSCMIICFILGCPWQIQNRVAFWGCWQIQWTFLAVNCFMQSMCCHGWWAQYITAFLAYQIYCSSSYRNCNLYSLPCGKMLFRISLITLQCHLQDSEGLSEAERELKNLKDELSDDFPVGPLIKKCCTLDQVQSLWIVCIFFFLMLLLVSWLMFNGDSAFFLL